MPWWAWLMEIAGVALLAASIAFSVLKTIRKKPLASLSLLISAVASTGAAILFALLSPARPPAFLLVLSILVGLAVGALLSFLARLSVQSRLVFSSHGYLHIAVWSFLLLVSSILVVASTGVSRAAVVIMLLASVGMAGYSCALYVRCAIDTRKVLREAETKPPGTSGS